MAGVLTLGQIFEARLAVTKLVSNLEAQQFKLENSKMLPVDVIIHREKCGVLTPREILGLQGIKE